MDKPAWHYIERVNSSACHAHWHGLHNQKSDSLHPLLLWEMQAADKKVLRRSLLSCTCRRTKALCFNRVWKNKERQEIFWMNSWSAWLKVWIILKWLWWQMWPRKNTERYLTPSMFWRSWYCLNKQKINLSAIASWDKYVLWVLNNTINTIIALPYQDGPFLYSPAYQQVFSITGWFQVEVGWSYMEIGWCHQTLHSWTVFTLPQSPKVKTYV